MLWKSVAKNAAPARRGLSSRQGLARPCSDSPTKPEYCPRCPLSHTTFLFFFFLCFSILFLSVLFCLPCSVVYHWKMWKEDKSNHLVQVIFFCATGRKCHLSKKKKKYHSVESTISLGNPQLREEKSLYLDLCAMVSQDCSSHFHLLIDVAAVV